MIFEEGCGYKSWGQLKKQMRDLLCDRLQDRIDYFYTRYHKERGSFGRATIQFDKKELVAFSWDVGIDVQWADEYAAALGKDTDRQSLHEALMKEKWMPNGTLCHLDFLHAVTTYLHTDVSSALSSDNYLLRIFAYLDRRVGKRTLIKIKEEATALPAWVTQFYCIRAEAEGL